MARTKEVLNYGQTEIHNIGVSICLRAVRDYCNPDIQDRRRFKTKSGEKKSILADLKGRWMIELTDGLSETIAKELETNEDAIKERLKYVKEE